MIASETTKRKAESTAQQSADESSGDECIGPMPDVKTKVKQRKGRFNVQICLISPMHCCT